MRFASYEHEGFLSEGGWVKAVLRANRDVLWECAHQHDSRAAARICAYQAEGQAIAAGLLPAPAQVRWNDPATWSPNLLKHYLPSGQHRSRARSSTDLES
jgi:hypothetical protein